MADVMVPEQLVHTSEVVVLLGNSWFAKCSAKQATHTVSRRIRGSRKAR
ncbi:hypothetical protein O3P69_004829 [Scylla paramamosain]|uniref:Uncharacterized protein n=1 Tax=Scylla paramamosain TaxID=85552 RepID=A0AAW0UDF6_SCYPA